MLDNFSFLYERGLLYIALNIILVLLDAIDYGYQKYMMDVLFHPFWGLSFTIGLVNLLIFGGVIILCLVKGKEESFKEKNSMFMSFYQYFEDRKISSSSLFSGFFIVNKKLFLSNNLFLLSSSTLSLFLLAIFCNKRIGFIILISLLSSSSSVFSFALFFYFLFFSF